MSEVIRPELDIHISLAACLLVLFELLSDIVKVLGKGLRDLTLLWKDKRLFLDLFVARIKGLGTVTLDYQFLLIPCV